MRDGGRPETWRILRRVIFSQPREAYTIERAAALSGVPRSTVYYWAKHEIWVPSVSPERTRLWSLADVLTMRAIYWLRSRKIVSTTNRAVAIPRTKMREVRATLSEILQNELDLSHSALFVDLDGRVVLKKRDELWHPGGQSLADSIVLDVLSEFRVSDDSIGPDLVRPRPLLRILPGKLSGEPHIEGTRVRTLDVDALSARGYTDDEIKEFYPFLAHESIQQARDLESQLRRNLAAKAA